MAVGVLQAFRENGIHPLVAFDDPPWAQLIHPPLTAVAQPAYEIGTTAAHLLLARIADSSQAPTTTTVGAWLLVRASSHQS